MRRAPILVLVNALLLAISGQAADASRVPRATAASRSGPDVSVEFDLGAGQGLSAHLSTFTDEIALTIFGHRQYANYQVTGEVSKSGVVAQFGKLGQVSVAFKPTKTLINVPPPKGCKGEAETVQKGIFSGIIELTGEREYVRLNATSAKGEMRVLPHWHCGSQQGEKSPPPPDEVTNRKSTGKRDVATLSASDRKLRRYFIAATERIPRATTTPSSPAA